MLNAAIRRFRGEEDGGVVIETILWIPVLLSFMLMVLDASVIYMHYSQAQRILHEGNRALATGRMTSCDELETWLETEISAFAPSATASCGTSLAITAVRVTMNTSEIDLTGATGLLGGMEVNMITMHTYEKV